MRQLKLTIAALFLISPFAANAIPIEITGAGANDGQWQIETIDGSFSGLRAMLMDQVWWGDDGLAGLFAETLGDALGVFGGGVYPSQGPAFAFHTPPYGFTYRAYVSDTFIGSASCSSSIGPDLCDRYVITWAIASRVSVPEPGTLALFGLGLGLLGMGLARRNKEA